MYSDVIQKLDALECTFTLSLLTSSISLKDLNELQRHITDLKQTKNPFRLKFHRLYFNSIKEMKEWSEINVLLANYSIFVDAYLMLEHVAN